MKRSVVVRLAAAAVAAGFVLAACGSSGTGTEGEASDVVSSVADSSDESADAGETNDTAADGATDGAADDVIDDDTPIRVGYVKTASLIPLYLVDKTYGDKVGINVEMKLAGNTDEIRTGLATGEFDVGFAGLGSGIYNAVAEGLPVKFVAPLHAGYLENYFIISGDVASSFEEAAKVASDMSGYAGKTFGVSAPGAVTDVLLAEALERVNLGIEDTKWDYIPFGAQVPALANGAVVASMLAEPFATQAEKNGSGFRPWPAPEDQPPVPFTGLLYNTDWAAEHPQLAEGYMKAYVQAIAEIDEKGWNADDMLDVVEEYTGSDRSIIADTRPSYVFADLNVDFDMLQRWQKFYVEQGTVNYDKVRPESDFWDFTWRDAVLGNR
jgi:ABC-type nitrate/sulfonate/bicarbonate transport system substrate-binding protein